jgi:hypothetical protein
MKLMIPPWPRKLAVSPTVNVGPPPAARRYVVGTVSFGTNTI